MATAKKSTTKKKASKKAPAKKRKPQAKTTPKLTEKQRRFVEAYTGVSQGNGTDAARRAGYKGNDNTLAQVGVENLRKPGIVSAINETTEEVRQAAVMTRQERQEWLTRVIHGDECRGAIVTTDGPLKDSKGELVTAPPSAKDRLKALELLCRMQGDFIERKEITGKDGAPIQVIRVGDQEIAF